MRMNDETRKIIKKELPWALPLIGEKTGDFHVELMDLDVLSLEPDGRNLYGSWSLYDRTFLIDSGGQVIGEVGVRNIVDNSSSDFKFSIKWPFVRIVAISRSVEINFRETVEMDIKRLEPESDDARFVLYISTYRSSSASAIVYKVPKRIFSLKGWLEYKAQEEASKIRVALEVD